MAPRLRSLTVRGFRAFGASEQTLNLPTDLAVVWGPNSKGKTSLAEAFEFLLTGRIVRRELMASSQDEFADALRNAHLADGEEVYVAASITSVDDVAHKVRRVLVSDYAKRQDCSTRLEIDGVHASEADLEKLGVSLSQPPLQAPVLAQHTLAYIFSVRPQDRTTYFKTLLEVTDLDDLRNAIAALADDLTPQEDPLFAKFEACAAIPALRPALDAILQAVPDMPTFVAIIEQAAGALILAGGEVVPAVLDLRLAKIEGILAERRNMTFPVRAFERKELAGWNPPAADTWIRLNTYLVERKKVDKEMRRLAALFDEALKLPVVDALVQPVDCPLCGTELALTPARVELIRQHVENTKDFMTAEVAAKSALTQLSASVESLAVAVDVALPRFLKTTSATRRETGFTIARIREVLSDRADEYVAPWLDRAKRLVRAMAVLRRHTYAARTLLEQQVAEIASALDPERIRVAFEGLATLRSSLADVISSYAAPASALVIALNEVLDTQADTAGWQDFCVIAREPRELRQSLVGRQALDIVRTELDSALKQIDRAKEQVLDDKFAEHSGSIQEWWERLRPDESTFFSAVQPRKGAKRTIDFKAGLSANPDRSAPKVRDVIAVFSQSQLHCLGLALFLARAQHENLGFIILDDPVLSSDEDYRVHFNSTVLTALIKVPIQVIVLTQDHSTWEEIETRYRHLGISTAQLFIETPGEGSIIENTSDALLAKINRARSLARGGHPDLRKECGIQLRDAGERFCKEMLVNDRRRKGEIAASLTDYDGKTLEWLSPKVDPLLGHDPSHLGKLAVFKKTVNHACHDNAPPGNAEMTQACGDIQFLVKDYLGR